MKADTTTTHHVHMEFPVSNTVRISTGWGTGTPFKSSYVLTISADGPEMLPLLTELRQIANKIIDELEEGTRA